VPDGRWLAVTTGSAASNFEIHLVDAGGSRPPVNVTRSGYLDKAPVFGPNGKAIFYISTRAGLQTADAKAVEGDVYAVFLTQDGYDAFVTPPDQISLPAVPTVEAQASVEQQAGDGTITEPAETPGWQHDVDGIEHRTVRITPFSGNIDYFTIAADGRSMLLVTQSATTGLAGYRVNLGSPGMAQVFAKPFPGGDYGVDAKGANLYFFGPAGIEHITLASGVAATLPFAAEPAGTAIGRDGKVITGLPKQRWSKPSILLANAGSYSDGSIFPHLYTQAKLGSFVGEPVPGTGTAVWWMPLLSGDKLKYGIPEIGSKDNQGNWF
jgi:tricorn protease